MATSGSKSATATRSATEIWLVGHPISSIEEHNQLPLKRVALRRIYYELKVNKSTLPLACGTVAEEIMSLWDKANIATTAKPHVVSKLKHLHQSHVNVSKHRSRQSAAQSVMESNFKLSTNKLFDIAHADWERRTTIQEDRQFLLDQRGPRQMSMTTEDKTYTKAITKYRRRKEEQEKLHQRHHANLNSSSLTVTFSSDDSDDSVDDNSAPYDDGCPSTIKTSKRPLSGTEHHHRPLPKAKRCIIDDPHFNAALDRTRTSVRQAMMIVTH